MGIRDYFRSIDTMTPQQVRDLLDAHMPGEYNLVDVRQPGEYRHGHLPGAKLIPLTELFDRAKELDPLKPTITY
ncbi:MAG: rhodanese-like domain-containing protein [Thermodesulfovibrionales bacterium]